MARSVIFFGVLFLAPNAWAGSLTSTADRNSEIIVTAPLEGSRIESLQGAMAYNRQDVIESMNSGLGETLAKSPGVSSSFFGAGSSRPIIRGLGEDRVRVLENGIGAIDAASASPDHAVTADGLDAERIEILRGAAALAYGGNAVGGVINVIDESIPTRRPQNGIEGQALATYTSANKGRELSLGLKADAGPIVVHVGAAGRETGDFEIPNFARSAQARAADPLPVGTDEVSGKAPNSWTSVRSYVAGASLIQDWGFSGLAFKRFETSYGLPPEDAASTDGGQIRLKQNRVEGRGDIRISAGPFDRLDWGAQYSDYTHSEIEDTGDIATTFENIGYEARIEAHNSGLNDKLDGAVGVQFTDTDFSAIGEESFITATTTRDIGAFTVQRWDNGSYGLEGGLRVEARTLNNELLGQRDFTTTSGSIGAFLRPAQNWFAGFTVARTERAPTAIESFANGPHLATSSYEVGNASLSKETALSFEASIRFESPTKRLELNLYHIEYSDYIALVPTGQAFVSSLDAIVDEVAIPVGEASLPVFAFDGRDASFTGGEVSASAQLWEAAGFTFTGDVALDIVRAEFDTGGALPRIPPRTFRVGVTAESEYFKGRLEYADIASQDRVATFESPTDGYSDLNARLTWRPQGKDGHFAILIDGRNLTDEEQRVHTSFLKDALPRPGRSVRLALSATF